MKPSIQNKRSPFILAISMIGMAFLLNSCQRASISGGEDTLLKIRTSGVIDACTVVDPPWAVKNGKTGELTGYYVDALNLIASKMNAKVVWHETTFGNVGADLSAHRCDVAAAPLFAIIPRAVSTAFTTPPIEYLGLSALIRKSDSRFLNVHNPMDFDKSDLTVVVATGEGADFWVKEHFKSAKVKRIDVESSDLSRFCVEVSAHRADVAIAGADTIENYAQIHRDVQDLFHENQFSLNPIGWAVRPDDLKWLHFLDTALQFLDTQGTLAQLEKKYNAHLLHQVKEYRLQ